MLLTMLVLCLGYAAHGHSAPATTDTTTMSAMSAMASQAGAPADQHTTAAVQPVDGPADGVCCGPVTQVAGAVLAAPAQPQPTLLPRLPYLPKPPGALTGSPDPVPVDRAPDLHVLQVQRT